MRKWSIIVLFLLFLSVQPTQALVVYPDPITVNFVDCYDVDYQDVHVDILVDPTDTYPDVLSSYRTEFPDYESFTFLTSGNYISQRAYIDNDTYQNDCEYFVYFELEKYEDFYVVIFQSDGTLLAQEFYTVDETGYSNPENQTYFYYDFDLRDNSLELYVHDMGPDPDGWEALLYIFMGFMIFIG